MNIFEQQKQTKEVSQEAFTELKQNIEDIKSLKQDLTAKLSQLEAIENQLQSSLKSVNLNGLKKINENNKERIEEIGDTIISSIKLWVLYIPSAIFILVLGISVYFYIMAFNKFNSDYRAENEYYKKRLDFVYYLTLENDKVWYDQDNQTLYFDTSEVIKKYLEDKKELEKKNKKD